MSTAEQEEIIQKLRKKLFKVEFKSQPKNKTKIDKKTVWIKAQKAGRTISDDDLLAEHSAEA